MTHFEFLGELDDSVADATPTRGSKCGGAAAFRRHVSNAWASFVSKLRKLWHG
jgi:hypothetical protein